MYPLLIQISEFSINSWTLMVMIGAWAAYFTFKKDLVLRGISVRQIAFFALGCIPICFAGAHLLQVLTVGGSWAWRIDRYSGFVLYGALFAAFAYGLLAWRLLGWDQKLLLQEIWDSGALALAWLFMFARIGCFLYGCCYGTPAGNWPGYFLNYDHWDFKNHAFPSLLRYVKLHPSPLYEALGFLGLILLQNWMRKREKQKPSSFPPGVSGWACWIGYGVLRFSLEFIRADPRGDHHFGLSPSQIIALTTVALGIVLIRWEKRQARVPLYLRRRPLGAKR